MIAQGASNISNQVQKKVEIVKVAPEPTFEPEFFLILQKRR